MCSIAATMDGQEQTATSVSLTVNAVSSFWYQSDQPDNLCFKSATLIRCSPFVQTFFKGKLYFSKGA